MKRLGVVSGRSNTACGEFFNVSMGYFDADSEGGFGVGVGEYFGEFGEEFVAKCCEFVFAHDDAFGEFGSPLDQRAQSSRRWACTTHSGCARPRIISKSCVKLHGS
jgi:hypothetical protein